MLGDRARGVSRDFVGPGQKISGLPSPVNNVSIVISRVVKVILGRAVEFDLFMTIRNQKMVTC